MRYFIHLSYNGTAYHGWQIQPNGASVQETLQHALSTLLRIPTDIVGAGRTDTGVHARHMVAHFNSPTTIDTTQLAYKLNKLLPPDIAIHHIHPVADDMHARFSATSRTYHYFIHTAKDPFVDAHSTRIHTPLNFEAMNEAAACLMQYTDFTSFSKVNTDVKTNLCTITHAKWTQVGPTQWQFTITANRFLRNMVRAIVGTLLEVGRGRITLAQFKQVIEQKNRCQAGESVPAKGLFLVDITY